MGNRAVIQVEGSKVGVYLHWNGGIESVTAFLKVAKDLKVRDPISDPSYFYARFIQIVGNFFGGTNSIGVEAMSELDKTSDNGVYVIGADFSIVKRSRKIKNEIFNTEKMQAIYYEALDANLAIFTKA